MGGQTLFLVNLLSAQVGEFMFWGDYPESFAGGASDGLRPLDHLLHL